MGYTSAQAVARRVNPLDVDPVHQIAEIFLAREHHRLGQKGPVERAIAQHRAQGIDIFQFGLARFTARDDVEQDLGRRLLPRFPTIEEIVVMGQQYGSVVEIGRTRKADGRGEVSKRRNHRRARNAGKAVCLLRAIQCQHTSGSRAPVFTVEAQRESRPVPIEECQIKRHREHRLLRLAGCRWRGLAHHDLANSRPGVVPGFDLDLRRARLGIPELELREVDLIGTFHRGDEVLDRRRATVVFRQIGAKTRRETVAAHEGLDHPYQFRSLFINRGGVEIVNFYIRFGPYRMRQRTRVFRELTGPKGADVGNPLHRGRAHIGREFLIPKNRQPFLQAELEPIAECHPVAGPIVEIFMGHDGLDRGVIRIRRGLRPCQYIAIVEDVEALVLHRPHVEIADRDDHEDIEIVFETEAGLVPAHRRLERGHRMVAAIFLAVLDENAKRDPPPRGRREMVLDACEIACHQREQIGRLRKGIVPASPMAAVGQVARLHRIAVREQDRIERLLRRHPNGEGRGDVRPVEIIGDPPESLRLALGAEVAARCVEALQLGVLAGFDLDLGLEGKADRRIEDRKHRLADLVSILRKRFAVDREGAEIEVLAVENQRKNFRRPVMVRENIQPRADPGRLGTEIEIKIDRLDQVIGGSIIGKMDAVRRCAQRHALSGCNRMKAAFHLGLIAGQGIDAFGRRRPLAGNPAILDHAQ